MLECDREEASVGSWQPEELLGFAIGQMGHTLTAGDLIGKSQAGIVD